ncbi:MAG: DUF4832 domain-containing protein [Ideonella sp.]|nr:DUF4832 domain-containing protein [Ideonella sp.]MCC7455972.1 DUF4832 domain-containing protein [Nitrospira sp.]
MASATFTADTTTDMPNPERGWYLYGAMNNSGGTSTNGLFSAPGTWSSECASVKSASFAPAAPFRIIFGYTVLDRNSDAISGAALANLDANLAYLRTAGLKTIIRFGYGTGLTPSSPSAARMRGHAQQLAATLKKYRDVIYLVQDGFIGEYGEWPYNPNGTSSADADSKANKRAMHAAVLAMLPAEVPSNCCQVYPMQEDWYPSPLSRNDAYSGNDRSRTGFHNDCFMASANDQFQLPGPNTINDFTFTSSALAQRNYVSAISEFAPMGGETCAGSAQRLACAGGSDNAGLAGGIMNEGPRYHLAYLNRSYYVGFHNAWNSGGCYSSVSRLMGYRFQFDSLSHADSVARGATLAVDVKMRNVGWARIYSARRLRAVLTKAGSPTMAFDSAIQLRDLPSQDTASRTIRVTCKIPAGADTGSWALHLQMADIWGTTQTRDFMIRPANANSGGQVWDDSIGRFTTGTTVTVT